MSTLAVNSGNNTKTWQPETPVGYWSLTKKIDCEWNDQIGLCWHKSSGANPYQSLDGLKTYWEKSDAMNDKWKAPNGIYWICGQQAYSELPHRWKGSCTLGIIQPSFFVLPRTKSNLLGASLYEILKRDKRELILKFPKAGGNKKMGRR